MVRSWIRVERKQSREKKISVLRQARINQCREKTGKSWFGEEWKKRLSSLITFGNQEGEVCKEREEGIIGFQ